MVVLKRKFICGLGDVPIHYCKVCGTPHLSREEAEDCEGMHESNPERRRKPP